MRWDYFRSDFTAEYYLRQRGIQRRFVFKTFNDNDMFGYRRNNRREFENKNLEKLSFCIEIQEKMWYNYLKVYRLSRFYICNYKIYGGH